MIERSLIALRLHTIAWGKHEILKIKETNKPKWSLDNGLAVACEADVTDCLVQLTDMERRRGTNAKKLIRQAILDHPTSHSERDEWGLREGRIHTKVISEAQ